MIGQTTASKHLVITTDADLSVECFRPFADIYLLGSSHIDTITKKYDSIYIRSHFSKPETMPQCFSDEIANVAARAANKATKFIDAMEGVAQILALEDKWLQYQIFRDVMPQTKLANDGVSGDGSVPLIFKKRISSRARGIAWKKSELQGDKSQWIAQEALPIIEELRIYVVCGKVYPVGAVRQSRLRNQKVKVLRARSLNTGEIQFAERIYTTMPQLDFIGLDVAITDSGLKLIEVNRSPDFATFTNETGINLADQLYEAIDFNSNF